jgi:hypothetical protein
LEPTWDLLETTSRIEKSKEGVALERHQLVRIKNCGQSQQDSAVFEKQTEQSNIKDQVSSVQVEYSMHRDMGNDEAAMGCIARIQQLQRELAALKNSKGGNTTATNASTRSSMEDPPPLLRRWTSLERRWKKKNNSILKLPSTKE